VIHLKFALLIHTVVTPIVAAYCRTAAEQTTKGENMKVMQLILEDRKGKHIHLSQKKILTLVDKIVRAVNPKGSRQRTVVYFSYQDVANA